MGKIKGKNKEEKPTILFEVGDKVKCVDFNGLDLDTCYWLEALEEHEITHIHSKNTEPILYLKSIEGLESPTLEGKPYPFMADRFEKVK